LRDAIVARATRARALSMSCALSAAGLASRFNRSVSLRPRTSTRPASVLSRRFRARTRGCEIRAADVDNMTSFLDEADFDAMREAMSLFDEQRDTVIKRSRDITKASKVAIYCLHRGEMDKADSQIAQALAAADELSPLVEANPQLRNSGSYSGGLEEYAEAAIFAHFIRTGTVLPSTSLPRCNGDEYLGGVLDFTGELNRYAVARATERDVAAVRKCRDVVDALMGIFLKFDFRNGALRKKYDGLKYTLKKMENTLYEMSLTSAAAKRSREDGEEDQPEGKRRDGDGDDE
jgi:predicted translin family RNA/ssDNA-binding protein